MVTSLLLIFALIWVAMAPATASAIPLDPTATGDPNLQGEYGDGAGLGSQGDDPTAVFKFVVPPVPDREDKTAVGGNKGWGGLFVSFNVLITKATFTIDPVLNDCVNVDPIPVDDDNKFGALPADSFLWKCNKKYQLDSVRHPGLTVTVTVESDDSPILLLVDRVDAADPINTFWWQKQSFNDDGTIRYTGDTNPIKLAAFPAPEPGTLSLLLSGISVLCVIVWRRKGQRVKKWDRL